MLTRRVLLGTGGLLLSFAVLSEFFGAKLFARAFGRRRYRFPYLRSSLSDAQKSALATNGFSFEQFQVEEGVSLNFLIRRPVSAQKRWLVYFPGNDAAQLRTGKRVLEALAQAGVGLVALSYRGYDSSEGVARLPELRSDALALLAHLGANESFSLQESAFVGFSIGAYLASRTAAELTETPPEKLVLFAPAADLVMVPAGVFSKLDPGDDFQIAPFLPRILSSTLVVQGSRDEAFEGPEQGRAVARALGRLARYEEIPGADHAHLTEDARAQSIAKDFLTESP